MALRAHMVLLSGRGCTVAEIATVHFFGALDAVTGEWYWMDSEHKLAVHFVAFPQADCRRLSYRGVEACRGSRLTGESERTQGGVPSGNMVDAGHNTTCSAF